MNKVLVAGATGYLGRHIVDELLAQKWQVKAIARHPEQADLPCTAELEVVKAEVTEPKTLAGLMEDVEVVISSVGITRQRDGLTYDQVDYQANLNLLNAAQHSGVKKFIYVSVLNGEDLRELEICKAKERFVDALKESGMEYSLIRPNGFFSDMASFVEMAQRGRVFLFGDGAFKSNPIHGKDLARVCVDAIQSSTPEIAAGGPDTFTQDEIARLAFASVGNPASITRIPDVFRRIALNVMRCTTSSKVYGPIEFFLTVLARDMLAPETGEQHLADFFDQVASNMNEGNKA